MSETALRRSGDAERAREWALVLESAGIAYHLRREGEPDWVLRVASRDVAAAQRLLDLYDEENTGRAGEDSEPTRRAAAPKSDSGLLMASLLVAFFLVTGPRDSSVIWFQRGSAITGEILSGEWWRTVTSLTLHSDLGHLFANVLSGAFFFTFVCRWFGPGLGWWLILLSGALGNALNGAVHTAAYSAVGASTSVFGALGSLCGVQTVRRTRWARDRWRKGLPLFAGFALFALIGVGEGVAIAAHLLGLLIGWLLGTAASLWLRRPPATGTQWALLLSAQLFVLGCWLLALGPTGAGPVL